MLSAEYVAFLGVVLAGSVLQGASGFGFGMTSMAVLPFVMDSKRAGVYVAVLAPALCAWLLWGLRRDARLKPVAPVLAGAILVGIPAGTFIYAVSDTWVFKQVIGLTLSASCTALWVSGGLQTRRIPGWVRFPVGALSGTLTGICNVGGAPMIVYMWMQPLKKAAANARLQTVFAATTMVRLGVLVLAPLVFGPVGFEAVTGPALLTAATALPAVALGGWIGLRLFRRLDKTTLRRCAYAFVILMGVALFAKTRWDLRSGAAAAAGGADSRPAAVSPEHSSVRR